MSEHKKTQEELEIDQLAACNVGGRIRAAISAVEAKELGAAVGGLEELLCFIEQRDLPGESPIRRLTGPETRLLEAVADIAFLAGAQRYRSRDSRKDVSQFIAWAREFETKREVSTVGEETYSGQEYMTAIESFALAKLEEKGELRLLDVPVGMRQWDPKVAAMLKLLRAEIEKLTAEGGTK